MNNDPLVILFTLLVPGSTLVVLGSVFLSAPSVYVPSGAVVTEQKIQQAKVFYQMHFRQTVFDEHGWRKILEV